MKNRTLKVMHISLVLLLGAPLAAQAQSQPDDIIKYRRNVMHANSGHTGAAGAILQGKVDYKNQLLGHAKGLEATNKDIPSLFPKGTETGKTRALPAVWEKRADFERIAKDAERAAAAFAQAVAAGDDKAAQQRYKELGDACKACHKDFRKEEK